ncbi:MAG: LamG domain-containing protein, partial [Akkermansiaceae bacterium]|nr:LamG domain-containing protein [Akkermansiaceae bacterium]
SKAAGVGIYIDGKLVGNKVEQDSLKDTIVTETPFKIGSRSQGGNYNGEVDELRIYHRALPEAEVRRLGGDPIKG